MSLNATLTGNATVTLTLGTTPLGDSPYTLSVIAAAPVPGNSYSYGSGLDVQLVAGTVGEFWIQMRDVFLNNITADINASVIATITALPPTTTPVQDAVIDYDSSGRLRATYQVTTSGNYSINVTVNEAPTSNSEHSLQVVPAALNVPTSVMYPIQEMVVVAGAEQLVLVQLKDQFGNNVTDDSASVTFSATSGETTMEGIVGSLGLGLYSVTYPKSIADWQLFMVLFN